MKILAGILIVLFILAAVLVTLSLCKAASKENKQ